MSSTSVSWKEVFSLKVILAGVILLFLGIGGFVYYYGQTPPVPVEQIPSTPLPEKIIKGQPTEDETTEDYAQRKKITTTKKVTYSTGKNPESNEIMPPTVNILNPTAGTTFVTPAAIKLEAEVLPKNREIEKVEFFYARISGESFSIYNTIKDVQIPNSLLIKIGEVKQNPYILENARLNTGIYSIYAIVTDKYGIRQISSPETIIVDDYLPKKNELIKYPPINTEKDIGWYPPIYYPTSILTPLKCMELTVESTVENPIVKNMRFISEGQKVDFKVHIKSPNQFQKFKYEWRITAGEILQGQNSNSITVDTGGLGGQILIATVRVEDEEGCSETVSGEAYILQQGDPIYHKNSFSGDETGKPSRLFSPPKHPYKKCSNIDEKLNFFTTFRGAYDAINVCPFNDEDPLDRREDLQMKLLANSIGIFGDTLSYKYFTNGGVVNADGAYAIWDLDSVKLIPGRYTSILEVDDGCESKNVTAKTVRITNYCMPCLTTRSFSNSHEVEGRVSFSTNLIANDENSSLERKLNYSWRISQGAIASGQNTNSIVVDTGWMVDSENNIDKSKIETSVEIGGLKQIKGILSFNANLPFNKNALSYDWTVSDSKGIIISGQKTKDIKIDTSKLKNNENIILSVKVSGFNILHFRVEPQKWAIEKSLTEKDIKYNWSVDKGTIISGQGTDYIKVDTNDLLYGTEITAIVEVQGVREYCVNEVYEVGRVGSPNIIPQLIDDYGALAGSKIFRRALRKNQNGEIVQSEIEQKTELANQTSENGNSTIQNGEPHSEEKEFIKIEWSKKPVQIQQSFSIIVTYNRVKEALEVKDTTGEVLTELKSKDIIQLIKDKWGDDYVVWAQIRLQSAGLYQSDTVTCSPNCQTDFLPLTVTEQKWTFNVTARNAGEHTFNIEMWIEGKHKETNYKTLAERVWGMDNLKVTVREDTPTKNQLFYSSGFLCFLGLVFAIRGVRFGNIKVLIAGGNMAGRDMAGGDIVHGDKIEGNKTTNLEVANDD